MPKRTTLRQRIVFVARRNLAGTDATVTESKFLQDLDDGEDREVDVVIAGTVGGEPVVIGVEVMEHSRPIDKPTVERLLRKHERLPTNRLVIVSWSGFYQPALAKVAASAGKAIAVTTSEVELNEAFTMMVESFRMATDAIVLGVRSATGSVARVTSPHGEGIELYDEDGTILGNVEDLVQIVLDSSGSRDRLANEFHEEPDKNEVWGFSFELPDLTQLPDLPPLFVKWAATGEMHRMFALGFGGEFKGYESQLDFKGLLLGEHLFGVAQGSLLGRDAIWLARQTSDSEARVSWHYLDTPAGE